MFKRFILAFALFVGLIIPGALMLALLAASAYPAPAVANDDGYAVARAVPAPLP